MAAWASSRIPALAQLYRDARIAPIYEGTNGIQANDLVGRKLARDNGAAARDFIAGIRASDRDLAAAPGAELAPIRASPRRGDGHARALHRLDGRDPWRQSPRWHSPAPRLICASSAPSPAAGSWPWQRWRRSRRLSEAPRSGTEGFLTAKLATARFYADNILAQAEGLAAQIIRGSPPVLALAAEDF